MAAIKSFASLTSGLVSFRATFVLLIVALASLSEVARSQNCSAELSQLMTCAPFAVPGDPSGGQPSPQCCASLGGVSHDCLCNTLRIISQMPSGCKLPPVNCGA